MEVQWKFNGNSMESNGSSMTAQWVLRVIEVIKVYNVDYTQ